MPVRPPPVSHRPTAFTLLELILVIFLLVVLFGLLLPAFHRAQRAARDTACRSNLKQWGQATLLYATDHDDWLPKDGSPNGSSIHEGWYVELPRALGLPSYAELSWRTNTDQSPPSSIWICPSNSKRSSGVNLFHYTLNQYVNGLGQDRRVKLSSIPMPATTVWLFDNGRSAAVARQNNVHTNLHRQGAHFLFLDSHVQWFHRRDYWDEIRSLVRLDFPELRWRP